MNSTTEERSGSFYRQYSADDYQRLAQRNQQQQAMMETMMANGSTGGPGMGTAQSLDDIIQQNSKTHMGGNTYQQPLGSLNSSRDESIHRPSMLDFGIPTGRGNDLGGFQFDTSPMIHSPTTLSNGGGIAKRRFDSRKSVHQNPPGQTPLDQQYQDMSPTFNQMAQSPMFQSTMTSDPMEMDSSNGFMPDLPMDMDFVGGLDAERPANMSAMDMYGQHNYPMQLSSSVPQQTTASFIGAPHEVENPIGNGREHTMLEKMPQTDIPDTMMDNGFAQSMTLPTSGAQDSIGSGLSQTADIQGINPSAGPTTQGLGNSVPTSNPQQIEGYQAPPTTSINTSAFTTGASMPNTVLQADVPQYLNAYSQSGFDLLGVLMRVATRPKPQINIGAVDMSCAFVVCDATKHDVPIVYCSEMFERLTGYTRHEILGRNCRFLQAPDGKVQIGLKRKYVDDQAVWHLKNMILHKQEAQISLINYRKSGQPFMNLLTMIPITWDSENIKYFVGFQVDLVEQPTSITNKNPDGSYQINYQRGLLPRYVYTNTPETNRTKDVDIGPPIERDDVSMVLSNLSSGDNELSKRIWDKVLLENTDDVLHVLSLKGLFLYLSQASRKILEYEPRELVGTALSSVCHPSDIVPVTRELKDTTPGATVNVVFRIRRKHSGYTWFESHGSLHTEQGKGKKCIILVGRERPVYALQRQNLANLDEIGDNELWTKMSTSGMFLFVSSHSRSLLDRQPDELRGTSAQALMRLESKNEFNRKLELARAGIKSTFKHDIQNKRGQTLHAQTTLYPGDASEGQKPTFLVAQTKLLRMSRSTAPALRKYNSSHSDKSNVASVGSGASSAILSAAGASGAGSAGSRQSLPPQSPIPRQRTEGIITSTGRDGLPIGNQHEALASEDNLFDELKTTRSTSWQFELRQMEKRNRVLAEEMQCLNSSKKKRKRRKGLGQLQKDCANCHTRSTPEWRRGPSGNRDLCNSCGLRWAKQNGRVSPRTSGSQHSDKNSASSAQSSPVYTTNQSLPFQPMADEKRSPQQQVTDSHNAKTNRMEAPSSVGYGGGIPPKIEEVTEPSDG